MQKNRILEGSTIIIILLTGLVGYLGFQSASNGQVAFMYFLREDGWVENLTVFFLLISSGIALYRAVGYWRARASMAALFWGFVAFMFFFAAGEEISWGQRIFNIETPDFFLEKNLQNETNLHNLEIGGFKINKWIFSRLLFLVMGFYLVALRPLSSLIAWLRHLVTLFQVPLPRWGYVLLLLAATGLFSTISLLKKSELIEFAFAAVFVLIFLNPLFSGKPIRSARKK